jgi:tetratricopeptide (TPR) repeat protein
MIRHAVIAVFAALLLLALPGGARAADNDPGFAFYEKQAKEVLKTAGAKVWEAAQDAERQGFHQFAIEQAQRALEFDPEQADAREYLKYEKKAGKWVQNEADFKAMPQDNVRPSNRNGVAEPEESMQKRIEKWREESLKKADKFVAARYAELGDICAAKGFKDQAQKGYEAAMRLDKENEKARKGLGYIKFGKTWMTKKQDDARKAASKSEVVKEDQPSQWENELEAKFNKVESLHFRIESTFPVDELQGHCLAAESAYAYYLADFGKDPGEDVFERGRMTFVIVGTEDQWNKLVDGHGGPDKEFTRQLTGLGMTDMAKAIRGGRPDKAVDKGGGKKEVTYGSTLEGRRDQLVHGVVHTLNNRVWKLGGKAWLDEGLTYYYTVKVLETCSTHCVALKKGDYANGNKDEGGLKQWDEPGNWKPLLKEMVRKKDDTPLRAVAMQPLTKLDFRDTVKAWGVASWLMDLDRDKFTSVLDQMLDPAVKQDSVIQGAYGKGYEELDEDWHRFALKSY